MAMLTTWDGHDMRSRPMSTQDAETDGVPTAQDTAQSAINFGGVFGLTSSAGADGGTASDLSFDLAVTDHNVVV